MGKTNRLGMHSGNGNFSELEVRDKARLPANTLIGDFYERYFLEEDFKQLPSINASIGVATNLDFEVLGLNASADDVTYSATLGAIQLQTDGGVNDQVIIAPHLDTNQSAWTGILWGTENEVIWEAVIRTDVITSIVIWAGLKLTNVSGVAADDDQVFFRFDAGIANWEAVSSIADTDVETDTNVPVVADTTYHLKIEIDSARKAKFHINDSVVHVTEPLTDDVALIPYIGVENTAGSTRILNVSRQKISRIIFE